jgi:hypothetical protein
LFGAASFRFEVHSEGSAAVIALAHANYGRGGLARPGSLGHTQSNIPALFIVVALAGCAVGPDYVPEAAPTRKTSRS